MNYPDLIQIETTTACNAHCSFCPHSDLVEAGRKGKMSDELLEKIYTELALWPIKPRSICPFLTNEPFADSRIFDICRRLRSICTTVDLTFFTNASLLSEEKSVELLKLGGKLTIYCSLHHTNADSYKHDLGLDFARTVANINRLVKLAQFPIQVLRVGDGTPADGQFIEFVRREIPGALPMVAPHWNWKGDRATHERELYSHILCPRGGSLTILHDGRVSLCCLDQAGAYPLGDITKQSMLEVFNGAEHQRFYSKPKCENSPCNKCNMR